MCVEEGGGSGREVGESNPLPPPLSTKENLDRFELCENPSTIYHANEMVTHSHVVNMSIDGMEGVDVRHGNWSFYSDRPGKPGSTYFPFSSHILDAGWISSSDKAVLEFKVKFGKNPRLMVGFLRSYEKLGDCELKLPLLHRARTVLLPGIQTEHRTSQVYNLNMDVKQNTFHETFGLFGVLGWGVEPNSSTIVKFQATSKKKFKLVYVIAC